MRQLEIARWFLSGVILVLQLSCAPGPLAISEIAKKSTPNEPILTCRAQGADQTVPLVLLQTPPSEVPSFNGRIIAAGMSFLLGALVLAFTLMRRSILTPRTRRALVNLAIFLFLTTIYSLKSFLIHQLGIQTNEGIIYYSIDFIWFFALGLVIVRILDALLWHGLLTKGGKPLVPRIIIATSNAFIFLIAALLFLRFALDQNITTLLFTSAGALLALVAYLSKPITDSAIAGFGLEASEIEKGHHVQVGQTKGVVHDIDSQRLTLISDDDNYVYLPNTEVYTQTVTNYSRPFPNHRCEALVTLEYEVTVHKARRLIEAAIRDIDGVLRHNIYVKEFGVFGITYGVQYWRGYDSSNEIQSSILSAIYYKVQKDPDCDFAYDKFEANNSAEKPVHREASRMSKRAHELKVTLLRSVEVFRSLAEDDVAELAEHCSVRVFGPPEKIIRQGEAGDSMFVVVEGSAKVYLTHRDNERIEIATDKPGHYFGEMALLTGKPRGATVQAIEDISLLEIPKSGLQRILERRPELAKTISEAIAQRQAQNQALKSKADARASGSFENNHTVVDAIRARMLQFFGLEDQDI